MARPKKIRGWRRDLPDIRDLMATMKGPLKLPDVADLEGKCPPVYDQGDAGSCTGNMGAGMDQFIAMKEGKVAFIPSRLFIYYNTRLSEGSANQDSGATIRDTFKAMAKYGYCKEVTWPYVIRKLTTRPTVGSYAEALPHKITQYARVMQSEQAICDALAAGDPVGFGFTVYDNFDPDAHGVIPMPTKKNRVEGGHAVVLVGYDRNKRLFKFRNSWGATWGVRGYGYLSFDYVLNQHLASDFWVLRAVP